LTKQRFASYNDTENFDRATFFYIIDDDAGNFEKATFNPNSMTLEVLTNLTYKQPLFGGGQRPLGPLLLLGTLFFYYAF
jgi:hypothetical protein